MIGSATVECMIYDVHSLKEKRSIIKQITHQIHKQFNISITEIDYHDLWQRCAFEMATVSVDQVMAEKILRQAIRVIDERSDLEVTLVNFEWL